MSLDLDGLYQEGVEVGRAEATAEIERIYDDLQECQSRAFNERGTLNAEIERLRQEIDVLRRYGNKDCTAMADVELDRLRAI